jgi:hypothetical protein
VIFQTICPLGRQAVMPVSSARQSTPLSSAK